MTLFNQDNSKHFDTFDLPPVLYQVNVSSARAKDKIGVWLTETNSAKQG